MYREYYIYRFGIIALPPARERFGGGDGYRTLTSDNHCYEPIRIRPSVQRSRGGWVNCFGSTNENSP